MFGKPLICMLLTSICLVVLYHYSEAFGDNAATSRPAPKVLQFQGRLLDSAGKPFQPDPGGIVRALFALYDARTNGTALWSSGPINVTVRSAGFVTVRLGAEGQPFVDTLNFGSELFLGVRVGRLEGNKPLAEELEMLPRLPIAVGLFAHVADNATTALTLGAYSWGDLLADGSSDPTTGKVRVAETLDGYDFGDILIGNSKDPTAAKIRADRIEETLVPPGTVIAFAGEQMPPGWLLCDGSAVSRDAHKALFDAIGTANGAGDGATTFNVPDYRGRFLRGVDHECGRDPDCSSRSAMTEGGKAGARVGSVQEDELRKHEHLIQGNSVGPGGGGGKYW